jgi:SAM-dependent methyltransferase
MMQSRPAPRSRSTAQRSLDDDVKAIEKILRANDKLDAVRAKHRGARWYKYLNIDKYLPFNVRLCRSIGLHELPPQRILDIGCGGGLFMYVARYYGHDPVGIDIEDKLLGDMAAALGVERRIGAVKSRRPVPVEGQFDLISCIGTVFDWYFDENHIQRFWSNDEWKYFFTDLERLLTEDGRVFLRINKGEEAKAMGKHFYDKGLEAALSHGVLRASEVLLDRAGLALTIERLGEEKSDRQ